MQQLSALDAVFLHMETDATPMHVGSCILFTPPAKHKGSFYPKIRDHITARMHLAPLFSRRLAFMPFAVATPVWTTADKVDIAHHIQTVKLPKPGTMAQCEAMIAKLHEGLLDRDRPLWQFTVVEGLQSGQIAFYAKIHHAALDGQGGVALAQAVLETSPIPTVVDAPSERKSKAPPTAMKLLGAAFRNTVAQYGKIAKSLPELAKTASAMNALSASAAEALKQSSDPKKKKSLSGVAALLPKGLAIGPRTTMNVAVSPRRAFKTLRIPLSEIKQIGRAHDAKLNDVVLALCSGALRGYFGDDKKILAKTMIGAVPASLRAAGDTSQSNQVTMMLITLATNLADPAKRIAAIVAGSTKAKMLTQGMKNVIPTDLPSLGVPWLMSAISTLYNSDVVANRIPTVANLVISNVPGPQVPLYMAGATMDAYFPVSIVTHGLGLNVTLHSYNGSLDIGLIACKKAVPDIARFAKAMEAAHQELLAASNPPSTPVPEAKPSAKKATTKAPVKAPKIAGLQPVVAVKKVAKKLPAKVTVKVPVKAPAKVPAKPSVKAKANTNTNTTKSKHTSK